MKVRELQEQLRTLDSNLDVVCYSADEGLLTEGRGFVLFDVSVVSTAKVQRLRLDDGTAYLSFNRERASETIAILEVTSDF
jgi:hypothetical protein